MEWVETTGKTLEDARDAALDMLGVDESDAEFVTITEPRPGLFGRLRGEARIRARVLPTTPPPKRGRNRRPPQRRDSSETRKPRQETASVKSDDSADEQPESESSATSTGPGGGQSRSARRRRNRSTRSTGENVQANGSGDLAAGDRPARTRAAKKPQEEEDTVTETLSLEEQGDLAKRFIEGLVTELGMQATVTARAVHEDETIQVAVDGDELGVLVGQGGATLAALQELARTVVQRKAGGHIERIFVDVAGYRAKRSEALARFTQKVVDDVISSGKDKALEPMSPADRKVVHDTVNDLDGAVTRSEGVEPRRYVVISPSGASDGGQTATSEEEPEESEEESEVSSDGED